jgi:NAD(P)-dependent dehydrogenase (short-subunit alcohol dehydrogenase family)
MLDHYRHPFSRARSEIMPAFKNRRDFLQGMSALALAPYLRIGEAQEVPRSRFGAHSTAEEVTEGIDLTGKTALVTGCNSGIGYETMRVLALRGAHVLGTARTPKKAKTACAGIKGRATPLVLELTDFDSIVACAQQVRAMDMPLDMLICNAGVLLYKPAQVNGLEMHFVVNHLGHFILVNRLMVPLLAAPQGRVVVVSSSSHWDVPEGGIQFQDLTSESSWRGGSAYGHSKLANGLFSLELANRLRGTNATSNCIDPGWVDTNIQRHQPVRRSSNFFKLFRPRPSNLKTVQEGAATTCYVATNPALVGVSGYYFVNCNPAEASAYMRDAKMAARLWEVSEKLAAGYLK